jgi:hypothetical protein
MLDGASQGQRKSPNPKSEAYLDEDIGEELVPPTNTTWIAANLTSR